MNPPQTGHLMSPDAAAIVAGLAQSELSFIAFEGTLAIAAFLALAIFSWLETQHKNHI